MHKIANNNIENLQTYVYTYPFLNSVSNLSENTNEYTISQIVELNNITSTNCSYEWLDIALP
jgi:hypothetical protein